MRDYLAHFIALGWQPTLYVSNKAATARDLFTNLPSVRYQQNYDPTEFDTVFLAGMDWQSYLPLRNKNQTVINLIQHVRHGDPREPLFQFLQQPAIRLCVSKAVKEAIAPHANGPCYVIKMGHDFPNVESKLQRDMYILANKQPELGGEIYDWAINSGFTVKIDTSTQERVEVISAMASSSITIALPNQTEGFYLPGIEAMYYSNSAIVPYCVANKEYYSVFGNLFMPEYSLTEIKAAILQSNKQPGLLTKFSRYVGRQIASGYTLNNERASLQRFLTKHFS